MLRQLWHQTLIIMGTIGLVILAFVLLALLAGAAVLLWLSLWLSIFQLF